MKNIISLVSREEIHQHMADLWRSEAFKRSHADKGYIFDQVERFAYLPRLFAETSNDYLERAHFCTWWNVIMIRDDYDNPIIHDLYYLHEMAHAASMPYIPGIGRAAFDEKMQRNELEASVASEIAVYFEMPGLREASFDYEIYADRFLRDPTIQTLWLLSPTVALDTLRAQRRDVMVSKPEHAMDLTERWIRRFADQNAAYSVVWADTYCEVEVAMAELQIMSATDRASALSNYRSWLEAKAGEDPQDGIPFRRESELFSPFYWSNKAKYAAAHADAA